MEKDLITSGESRRLLIVNGKPVNPRTFEKVIHLAKVNPAFVIPGTGVRLFKRKEMIALAKKMPKTLKRGSRLKLRKA